MHVQPHENAHGCRSLLQMPAHQRATAKTCLVHPYLHGLDHPHPAKTPASQVEPPVWFTNCPLLSGQWVQTALLWTCQSAPSAQDITACPLSSSSCPGSLYALSRDWSFVHGIPQWLPVQIYIPAKAKDLPREGALALAIALAAGWRQAAMTPSAPRGAAAAAYVLYACHL